MISRNLGSAGHDKWYQHTKYFYAVSLLCLFVTALQIKATSFADESMLARLHEHYGEDAHQRGVQLNRLLNDARSMPEQQQLVEINEFFNQFIYTEDKDQWDQLDYWATPEEFIGTHQGDCEDYVIAKYFALRSLGISEQKLYLTYVKSTTLNVSHMVLTYFRTPKSIPLVLDNYDHRIFPANQRKDLLPVYSFNVKSLFLTNPSAGLGRKLPSDKVQNSKWKSLLNSLEDPAR